MAGTIWYLFALLVICLPSAVASASDVDDLGICSTNVFSEIAKTQAWSGRTKGCIRDRVVVEQRDSGIFVTTWKLSGKSGNWEKLALSAAAGYRELIDKKLLAGVIRDVKSRARRLDTCLTSIKSSNDPGECRDSAQRVYSVGTTTGVDMERTIWLDDGGRHVVIGYSYGDSTVSDTVPADLENTPTLPAGVLIDLHMGSGRNKTSK
jgi:hypothetical protein